MKDLKIRLGEKEYGVLRKRAKDQMRSINKQVTIFILAGLGADENKKNRKKRLPRTENHA